MWERGTGEPLQQLNVGEGKWRASPANLCGRRCSYPNLPPNSVDGIKNPALSKLWERGFSSPSFGGRVLPPFSHFVVGESRVRVLIRLKQPALNSGGGTAGGELHRHALDSRDQGRMQPRD